MIVAYSIVPASTQMAWRFDGAVSIVPSNGYVICYEFLVKSYDEHHDDGDEHST